MLKAFEPGSRISLKRAEEWRKIWIFTDKKLVNLSFKISRFQFEKKNFHFLDAFSTTIDLNLNDINTAKNEIENAYNNYIRILTAEKSELMSKVLQCENEK